MNKLTVLAFALGLASMSFGQVKMPDLSPRCTVNQKVGLTDFTVDYARPSVRERQIFGDVIPYGEVWRLGANLNTTLEFNSEITFAGKTVKPGKYGVYAKPEKQTWTVYLYADSDQRGVPSDWNSEKIVAEVRIPTTISSEKQETFLISFENLTTKSGTLTIRWENTRVDLLLEVPSKELALESIEKTMSGPTDRDYYNAASFYLEEKIELKKALEYITKAVELRGTDAFWYTRKKALIEFELGDVKAAIQSAQLSLDAAKKANYASYVKMNEESIKEWSKKK